MPQSSKKSSKIKPQKVIQKNNNSFSEKMSEPTVAPTQTNTSGSKPTKKIYDSEFLMKFSKANTEMPEGLEEYRKMIEDNQANQQSGQGGRGGHQYGRGGGGNSGRSGRGGRGRTLKSSNNNYRNSEFSTNNNGVASAEYAPFVPSENRWQRPNKDGIDGNTKVLRLAQGMLNKITPEKFEKLSQKILDLIDNKEILDGVVKMIFEKAVRESKFCKTYANLCHFLYTNLDGNNPTPIKDEEGNDYKFRSILIQQCQEEFQREKTDRQAQLDALKDLGEEEREEKLFIIKQKSIGNTKFIGELFKKQLLSFNTVLGCIERLMPDDVEDIEDASPIQEDDIENLCKLLTTIGQELERLDKERTDQYFERMGRLSKRKILASRYRFMILDLLDLKKEAWIPRRKEYEAKSISEIHEEVRKNEEKKDSALRMSSPALPTSSPQKAGGSIRRSHDSNLNTNTKPASIVRSNIPPIAPTVKKVEKNMGHGWETAYKTKQNKTVKTPQPKASKKTPTSNPFFFLENDDDKPSKAPAKKPANAKGKQSKVTQKATQAIKEETPVAPKVEKPQLTLEEAKTKLNTIFEEYITSFETEEAIICISELNCPEVFPKVVNKGFVYVVEKKDSDRNNMSSLLVQLGKKEILSSTDFVEGFKSIVTDLQDLEVDVPHSFKYAVSFIVDALISENITLKNLEEIVPSDSYLIEGSRATEFIADIFVKLLTNNQIDELKKSYQESGIELSKFLSEGQNEDTIKEAFTKKNEELAKLFA